MSKGNGFNGMGDNTSVTKGPNGQSLVQAQALDRSSAGAEMNVREPMKGGVDYLGHSLKGVSAVQSSNGGGNPGRKSRLD